LPRPALFPYTTLFRSGQFTAVKFGFNVYASGNEDRNPDNTFMIFRYADAILLHAEALAELSRDTEAIASLNMIRNRAEATPYARSEEHTSELQSRENL